MSGSVLHHQQIRSASRRRFPWRTLLTRWSQAVITSRFAADLPGEVINVGWLGYPGASAAQIAAAETRLNTTLPPSYREFLRVTNGWRRTTPFVAHLSSTETIQWYVRTDQPEIDHWLQEEVLSYPVTPISDDDYLVYGTDDEQPFRPEYLQTALVISGYTDGIYLLNPQTRTAEGEWEAWFLAYWMPTPVRYRSFCDLMRAEFVNFLHLKAAWGT